MSYKDRLDNEVDYPYKHKALELGEEADKEIADLKMEIEADDRNVNDLIDQVDSLGKELEAKDKENKKLHEDYRTQNKCIADQHDQIEAQNKVISELRTSQALVEQNFTDYSEQVSAWLADDRKVIAEFKEKLNNLSDVSGYY